MSNALRASLRERERSSVARPKCDPGARFDQLIEKQPTKLSIDFPYPSSVEERQLAHDRPSLRVRTFRLPLFSVAVFVGVVATLGWQSYGDAAREIIVGRVPTLASLLPVSTMKSPVSSVSAPETVQQLMPLTFGLEVMRRSVDQIASKQEQISQNIAALQAVEEDVRQKVSSTTTPPSQASASSQQPKRSRLKARSPASQASSVPRSPSESGFVSR
jgi:hypothetical protein